MQDVPTLFYDYAPSNFKDKFHGAVSVKEALQQSLNIPAVAVLEKIGPGFFTERLRNVGISLKFESEAVLPSLSVALGGVGIRLYDLVALYAALANQGEFLNPLILRDEKAIENNSLLLDSKAAWHVKQILMHTPPPEGFMDFQATHEDSIAYKTGTSYGFRDAWAIGFNEDFTVGVWMGRPDGTPHADQTGRSKAAPLLFKIFNLLPHSGKQYENKAPEGLLSLNSSQLPPILAHFKRKNSKTAQHNEFRIIFPREGSTLKLEKEGNIWHSVLISLSGGKPPFYVFENGHPLSQSFALREIKWQPKGLGFTEITIIDSEGSSSSVTLQFR